MRRLAPVALVVLLAATLTCKDGSGPVAGELRIQLTTPNPGADSAMVITVTGPVVLTSATAGPGLRVFAQPLTGVATKFALVGRLDGGATVLVIGVNDVSKASSYAATVNQVARGNHQLRPLLAGYSLTVTR